MSIIFVFLITFFKDLPLLHCVCGGVCILDEYFADVVGGYYGNNRCDSTSDGYV